MEKLRRMRLSLTEVPWVGTRLAAGVGPFSHDSLMQEINERALFYHWIWSTGVHITMLAGWGLLGV